MVRALGLAMGGLGVAALFPIRSLGPDPGRDLSQTPWRDGVRLVTDDGRLVRAEDRMWYLDKGFLPGERL